MRAKKTQSKRVNPEPGVHIARLKQIIDLGSQVDSFSGDEGRAKLEFIWELPESLHTFNEDKGPQPLIVSRKYGNTLGRGSGMKKAIESMLGHSIEKDFELDTLLDEMCNLNLSIEQDGEYENVVIQSLMPLTKDQSKKKYPTYSEAFILDLDNMDWDVYESLPDWKKEMIAKSPEYAEVAANRPTKAKAAPAPAAKPATNGKAAPAKSNAVASAKSSPFAKKTSTPAKGVAAKAKK
jgi:hypothetical protein